MILYRISNKVSEDGRQHYQFWLWAAARPPRSGSSGQKDAPSFDHLDARIGFDDDDYEMLA
ncbi:hypothetical protein ACFFQF_07805 [Haladaptatus pallidirubidus]|uniref:hypothetical protein n=1 Tax=Haladaptatus pallidirubidus TaxID=1008152 RepID=UPI0035EB8DCE